MGSSVNPITRIRKRAGKSLQGFADDAGIHVQGIYLIEAGAYPRIFPRLLAYIETLDYDPDDVAVEYEEWVHEQRERVSLFVELPDELGEPDLSVHPFISFREGMGLSRMAFCKTFLVHSAAIYELEHGRMLVLPGQLVEALRDVGVAESVIDELAFRCNEFTLASRGAA